MSASTRALPDFLVLGAQKAGTSSFYSYLTQFPDVRRAVRKEVHFFDNHYDQGERWYRSWFPVAVPGRSWRTGEATPYYLLHPAVPGRVAESLPGVRLIALLRHPVARAYSHFQHSRDLGKEPVADFETAVALEAERTDEAWSALERDGGRQPAVKLFSYVRRGLYAPQLRRWLDAVPAESLLLLTAEELSADSPRVIDLARRHIGLPSSDAPITFERRNSRTYDPLSNRVRGRLGELFADDVAEVERILGRPTGWQL